MQDPGRVQGVEQKLGHDKVLTTFLSYGQVESPRQRETILGLGTPRVAGHGDVSELAKALVREIRRSVVETAAECPAAVFMRQTCYAATSFFAGNGMIFAPRCAAASCSPHQLNNSTRWVNRSPRS